MTGRRLARAAVERLLGLAPRQVAGILVVLLLCAGVAAASLAGQAAVATCLLGLLLVAVLAGVIHLIRRIGAAERATRAAVRDLREAVDQAQRRVLASVEKERLAAGDRHLELLEAVNRTERLTGRGAELLLRDQSHQIEALLQLFQAVSPRAPMPAGDTLNPTDLLGLVHVARERRPRLTVVLGSGPATVWLGYALAGAGSGLAHADSGLAGADSGLAGAGSGLAGAGSGLVAVDHDAARAERTRARLAEHGLTAVEVRHAPLAELSVEGRTVDWYDVDALAGLHDIDLLVVDHPPGPDALGPALHVLGRRLAGAAAVVVDEQVAPVAPRQGGSFGLTVRRPLPGRWTVLAHPAATGAGRQRDPAAGDGGVAVAGT